MLKIINILDLMEEVGEDTVRNILSNFVSENNEVEEFIKNKAIEFAKRKWSITYLVSDSIKKELLGIFTLASKAVQVGTTTGLSNSIVKRINEFSIKNDNGVNIASTAYLLAQFSKNKGNKEKLSGDQLLTESLKKLREVQTKVGGKLLWLECENTNQEALSFYQKEEFGFQQFNTRYDEQSGVKYIQMIRSF